MSTHFDNTWQALLQPGVATEYFNIAYPSIQLTTAYSPVNALWMAEVCRLLYRTYAMKEHHKKGELTRDQVLNRVGLRETHFIDHAYAQCAITQTQSGLAPACAILVFRGSHQLQDWLSNLKTYPTPWSSGGKVHKGFKDALEQVWVELEQVLTSLTVPVFYTGHSLGGALATLTASLKPPLALYTFGSPRVGDSQFAKTCEWIQAYRVVNNRDLVTTVPPSQLLWKFCHVGELHYITHDNQMWVNPSDEQVSADRGKMDVSLWERMNYRQWFYPPKYLADHAPVNYVAHLERFVFVNE